MAVKKNFNTSNNNPNFKKGNPNAILAGENKEPESTQKDISAAVEPIKTPPEPQQKKSNTKKGQKYLRLDITNYQNYISLMADYASNTSGKYVSMTQYILRLIEADKQQNIELYEKLEQIENMKRELT